MIRFVLRRFIWAVPTLMIVTFLAYCALRLGTDPVAAFRRANGRVSAENVEAFRQANGLYEGVGGLFRGYFKWLGDFVTGDWPNSIRGNTPVAPQLRDALANSLRLGGLASIIGIVFGCALGVVAALRPGSLRDGSVNTLALVMLSLPPFVTAVVLQMIFSVYTTQWFPGEKWLHFPTSGVYPPGQDGFDLVEMLRYLTLPVIVVAIQAVALYTRNMRASLLDVLSSDYLRTARSKGISGSRVLLHHAVRNAMIPIATLAALQLGALFSGLIITENIFEYPGMGRFLLTAYSNGDFPQLMPWMVVVIAAVILFNLLADLSYARLDPRIRV